MSNFIKNAIVDRLKELMEEQDSLISSVKFHEAEHKRLLKLQLTNELIIREATAFLKTGTISNGSTTTKKSTPT